MDPLPPKTTGRYTQDVHSGSRLERGHEDEPVTKNTRRRKKGTGTLVLRGNVWHYWLKEGGKFVERVTTGCSNKDDARAWVRDHLKEVKKEGTKVAFDRPKKITVEVLLTTLRDHYTATGKASA